MLDAPRLAILVPALNAAATIEECVRSAVAQEGAAVEVIVADDGSTDGTPALAEAGGARVLRLGERRGPGAARNAAAAAAHAGVLLVVDADVTLPPDLAARVLALLDADPRLDGVIGAYTPDTPAPGWVTRFKNLQHHFVHRTNAGPVSTFWGACGAIRRRVFEAAGGFVEAMPHEVLEDVELGYRVTGAGGRLRLDPSLRVTHHRRYSLASLVHSDLRYRAIPWTRTLLERGEERRDLVLKRRGVAGTAGVALALASLATAPFWPPALIVSAVALGATIALDAPFHLFVARRAGVRFVPLAIALQLLYHVVCGLGFALGHLGHRRAPRAAPAAS